MSIPKRVGILTSGGDCAGLNAVIRAVVRRARAYDMEIYGIEDSTEGLMMRPVRAKHLTVEDVVGTIRYGGTMIGTTNKGNPFAVNLPDGTVKNHAAEIIEGYRQLALDALIGVGGDGSLAILRKLALQGNWNLVGVPKTIDNDLGSTDYSIGFNTSVSIATEALDRLSYTAASHNRVMVLEVMGRDAGHIALSAGIAGAAQIILIPEIPYSIDRICDIVEKRHNTGRNHTLLIVAEAVKTVDQESLTYTNSLGQSLYGGIGRYIADYISSHTSAEVRVTTLGHVQRGGTPSAFDRILGTAFGVAALDLVAQGKFDRMVAWQNRQVVNVPIEEAIAEYRAVSLDDVLIKTAIGIGSYVGEIINPVINPIPGGQQ